MTNRPTRVGDNGAVVDDADGTDEDARRSFRGAHFTGADFTGAVFRDCDLRGVKIADSWLTDIDISGLLGKVVVNDVDVAAYVEAELDRRNPELVQLREMRTADEYRAMWATVERLWSGTLERARRMPEDAPYERVGDEWSLVETLRHLVFVIDAWASRTVLDEPKPYHPLGYPHSSYPPDEALDLGVEMDAPARPSTTSWRPTPAGRPSCGGSSPTSPTPTSIARATVRRLPATPTRPARSTCLLKTVMREECEHRRYAERDLDRLDEPRGPDLRLPDRGHELPFSSP